MRGRAVAAMLSLSKLVGCGESLPSVESSDDTHSIADLEDPTREVVASVPGEGTEVGDRVEPEVVATGATDTIEASATVPTTIGSPVVGSTASAPPTTVATPVTNVPLAIPCDAVPNASCAGADLRGQELMFANLQGADFRGANLAGVDLSGADLSGANLTNANLTNANLSETVLFGTDFTGVRLSRTNLQFVLWDDSTIWPSGFTPPDF
ncbi:MAG: pentapeptide repeat-containing protein [Acidimicrobiia bacterium]